MFLYRSVNLFSLLQDVDLQRCPETLNKAFKEKMDEQFRKVAVQQGDAGFVYDTRATFENPTEAAEWDDSDD